MNEGDALRTAVDHLDERFRAYGDKARELGEIDAELKAAGYTGPSVVEGIEPPHMVAPLPPGLWTALCPPEVREALAVWRSTPPGTLNNLVQSGQPGALDKAREITQLLNQAEAVLSALTTGITVDRTPQPGMPEVVLGESRAITQPGGIAHG